MKFLVIKRTQKAPKKLPFPCVILRRSDWDDYGYKTTFDVSIHLSPDDTLEPGPIKIMHEEQEGGYTPMPEGVFTRLPIEYCSLGNGLEYYEKIYKMGKTKRESYLKALGDVAWSDTRASKFEDLQGFKVSLLRFSGSERIIADARKLLKKRKPAVRQKRRGFRIRFKTRLAHRTKPILADFSFVKRGNLPNRVNALIGYNGTGKTKLLSNLAMVASQYGFESAEDSFTNSAGRFVVTKPPVHRVIVISYSAFDTFVIPDADEAERVGYIYCGLRMLVQPLDGKPRTPVYALKNPEAIELDFIEALKRVINLGRQQILTDVLKPLLTDSSFKRIGLTVLLQDFDEDEMVVFFNNLSSGHKIVVKIIIELVAYLEGTEPTLVLIDEPETHLHPPLVASLLQSLRESLEALNGFAIIATHSPVVLQETPSRYVNIIRRFNKSTTIESPKIETFGESIGTITHHVFTLDDSETDWHETLEDMAKKHNLEEIENLLGRPLGFAARSYVASLLEFSE